MEVSNNSGDIELDNDAVLLLRHARGQILIGWNRFWLATDSFGTWVAPRDETACKWCLLGSLVHYTDARDDLAIVVAESALEEHLPPGCIGLATFNDYIAKSADDVIELIDKAIAKLEANSTTV